MKKLLIVDDCGNVIRALYRLLNFQDYELFCSGDPREALEMVKATTFDVVLTDQRMPGMTGVELLSNVEALQPDCVRICMSGYKDFEDLMAGFNSGLITHFVQKPWDNSDLKTLLASYLSSNRGGSRRSGYSASEFLFQNEKMASLLGKIDLLAGKCTPVFIHGETGTGKELVARAIHSVSTFSSGKFVAVNCNNLSETLLESQLFGHRKGAFTGAVENQAGLLSEAHNGTLFLDEVTDLPYPVQCKLLRVLQEREYTPVGETKSIAFDAQIISAGSTRLETAAIYAQTVAAGQPIRAEHLPEKVLASDKFQHNINGNAIAETDTGRENILNLLERYHGNKSEVARQLGISRMSLWRQMKRLALH